MEVLGYKVFISEIIARVSGPFSLRSHIGFAVPDVTSDWGLLSCECSYSESWQSDLKGSVRTFRFTLIAVTP